MKHDMFLHCCIFDDVLKLNWYLTFVYVYPKKRSKLLLSKRYLVLNQLMMNLGCWRVILITFCAYLKSLVAIVLLIGL